MFDEAIAKAGDAGFSAEPYLAQEAVSDASELDPVIDAVIAANPGQVAAFRGGKEGLLGFFVGQVMKETGGSAESAGRQRARAREARLAAERPASVACPSRAMRRRQRRELAERTRRTIVRSRRAPTQAGIISGCAAR